MFLKLAATLSTFLLLASCTRLLTATEKQAVLNLHNNQRCSWGIPQVKWDTNLESCAQAYADSCQVGVHSTSAYKRATCTAASAVFAYIGENLAWGSAGAWTADALASGWVREKTAYLANNNCNSATSQFTGETGHYTQMIWKETTKIGCAIQNCGTQDQLVCHYGYGGNVNFQTNYCAYCNGGIASCGLRPFFGSCSDTDRAQAQALCNNQASRGNCAVLEQITTAPSTSSSSSTTGAPAGTTTGAPASTTGGSTTGSAQSGCAVQSTVTQVTATYTASLQKLVVYVTEAVKISTDYYLVVNGAELKMNWQAANNRWALTVKNVVTKPTNVYVVSKTSAIGSICRTVTL